MRYHLDILKDLERQLANEHMASELAELKNEVLASATGGELCARVGSWLLTNKNKGVLHTDSLNQLANEFIAYCRANGIVPHARYS